MAKLRVLDLFSGIGGFSLGLERTGGFETAAFCECEDFPRQVLAKHWPGVPCFPDVRELKGEDIVGPIDVICGGYPCQPFSQAGQRRGQKDDRHLWPEFSRLVAELRPAWVIGENVAGHISMGLDDVLSDLERQGYACRTFVIPACATGAPHRRDRVWTIASRNDADADSIRSHRAAKHVIRGCEPSDRQISLFGSFCEVLAGSGGASVGEASDVADADIDERRPLKSCGSGDQRQDDPGGIQGREESTGQSGKRSQLGTVADASELQRDGSAEYRKQGQRQIQKSGKRGRAQLVADAQRIGQSGQGQHEQPGNSEAEGKGKANHVEPERQPRKRRPKPGMGGMADGLPSRMDGPCRWPDEPDIGRVANGVKNRANRLKALGNAVVPQVVEMIGRTILEAEKQEK